jgi:catechol-2,3-dioxygenase
VEQLISDLVNRFERGGLTRRQLVQALALVALTGRTTSAAGLQGGSINHTSVLVSDLPRSIDFYRRVFGLTLINGIIHVVTTILIGMCAMLLTAVSYGRMARAYPSAS